ncbi:MAG: tRNA-dihydrouridine synthase family protein [Lachnospiraceae bacterium]|nr:tRNA-dihydrouridine synthase family protein [Lachnospiraceae bacterium]
MRYYLAPMEGITGYIFRNALHDHFGEGIDKYYTPFLVVHEKIAVGGRDLKDVLPAHNVGINLVPQILTNDADGFLRTAEGLAEFGYKEVNLNLGCPSKTVAGKGRGSGFLADTEKLDDFLYRIFEDGRFNISVKTRIGVTDPEEFGELIGIFNKYPIRELIIHPRVRYEYYKGKPHRDIFYKYFDTSANPVCYNGDIFSKEDMEELKEGTGGRLGAVMIGRGILMDPSLIRTLSGGKALSRSEIMSFLDRIRDDLLREMSSEKQVLMKLKELWGYLGNGFPGRKKELKQLLKCGSLNELKMLQMQILGDMKEVS